jgi:hypothetical protein
MPRNTGGRSSLPTTTRRKSKKIQPVSDEIPVNGPADTTPMGNEAAAELQTANSASSAFVGAVTAVVVEGKTDFPAGGAAADT